MAIKFNRSQTFATNGTVNAPSLHNLVDGLDIYQSLITDQTNVTSVSTADELLIAIAAGSTGDAPKAVTVQKLFQDALSVGTYTNANISEALSYGTATGTRLVSANATITTGTITTGAIPSLTAGTTTSTAATITSGTITNLASTTGTIATLNSTTGTIATLNSTTGTIATLNSTTGTIGNLSTTLAGDFTISNGTATLATSGATAGTYGSVTAIPFLTVNAKGIITSATTGTFSTTPSAGSITFPMLSTSTTEANNTASRVARAWVNFDGTVVTNPASATGIRDDFNVSSILDNGTGDYTVNFSANLANANYCVVGISAASGSVGAAAVHVLGEKINPSNTFENKTTSVCRVLCVNNDGDTATDAFSANVLFFAS
jgi:hypothetical protein